MTRGLLQTWCKRCGKKFKRNGRPYAKICQACFGQSREMVRHTLRSLAKNKVVR